jgi:hypothetical protein
MRNDPRMVPAAGARPHQPDGVTDPSTFGPLDGTIGGVPSGPVDSGPGCNAIASHRVGGREPVARDRSAVNVVAIVALVTISVGVAALVATRFVLPAADGLDERLAYDGQPGAATARC